MIAQRQVDMLYSASIAAILFHCQMLICYMALRPLLSSFTKLMAHPAYGEPFEPPGTFMQLDDAALTTMAESTFRRGVQATLMELMLTMKNSDDRQLDRMCRSMVRLNEDRDKAFRSQVQDVRREVSERIVNLEEAVDELIAWCRRL